MSVGSQKLSTAPGTRWITPIYVIVLVREGFLIPLIKNEKGKYEAVKSNPVDDLYELPGEYKYVKKEFCDVEYLYDMKSVLTCKNSSEKVKIRN